MTPLLCVFFPSFTKYSCVCVRVCVCARVTVCACLCVFECQCLGIIYGLSIELQFMSGAGDTTR